MYRHQTVKWYDVIEKITQSYNSAIHRSIKMSPIVARETDPVTLWNNQYTNKKTILRNKTKPKDVPIFKLELNDKVRLVAYRSTFHRAYDENWTKELFIVTDKTSQQGIAQYSIKSYDNEPVIGKFYENELEKVLVDENTIYKIDKIIRKKTIRKKKGYIVSWMGWGKEYNSWVPQKDVKHIRKLK